MPLIGTAGHVDHGKSTLVQALTGRDPDRWAEEKRRGLTLDLGFGWADLGDGTVASFVDVPGHERYLKNMLAGVEAIDVAMFVVAANEGWKPQSEEHLAALDLLEVGLGVVALTKVDLVDHEMVELATLEIEEQLVGTSLEGSAVIPVSATTGEGLDELRAQLVVLCAGLTSNLGRPRLWVDRVFTIAGVGTVVTGSLLGGPLAVGQEISAYPRGKARIRSIQSHEEELETVEPGRRVALGLVGDGTSGIARGTMIGLPAAWNLSRRFSATIRNARYIDDLPDRGAYQIHLGSQAQNVTIEGQNAGRAILRLDRPAPIAMGDRFIIRDSGRRVVAAGGRVLDPNPGSRTRALTEAELLVPEFEPDENATQLLRTRGVDTVENLMRDSDGGQPLGAVEIGGYSVTTEALKNLEIQTTRMVSEEHQRRPLNPGLPLATLATQLGVPAAIAEEVVRRSTSLQLIGPDVSSTDHSPTLSREIEIAWESARTRISAGLSVPNSNELGLGVDALHLLVRNGDLVRINDDLVYLPDQVDQIIGATSKLTPPFSVGEFKDALGLTRKYAMPILEWLDENHFTLRRGDQRVFGSALPTDSD